MNLPNRAWLLVKGSRLLALAIGASAVTSSHIEAQASGSVFSTAAWSDPNGFVTAFCNHAASAVGTTVATLSFSCPAPANALTSFQGSVEAAAVAGGPLKASSSVTGTFLGTGTFAEAQAQYTDELFYNPAVSIPLGSSLIFSLVLEGSNPSTLSLQGDPFSSSQGTLAFAIHGAPGSNTQMVIADQADSTATKNVVVPFSSVLSPQVPFADFTLTLQALSGINATGALRTTTFDASAASLFFGTGFVSRIEVVDAQGNDITQLVGLGSASGSLGVVSDVTTTPEPATLALMMTGLCAIGLVRGLRYLRRSGA